MSVKIIVIGGGVVGTLIARALLHFECSVILLEKHNDVAVGTSKANSGIVHAGFDAAYKTNKAHFNVLGNAMMSRLCESLKVSFTRNESYVLAFDKEQEIGQKALWEQGLKNGVSDLSIISGDEARESENALSKEVVSVLVAKTGGIVCPYSLTTNAAQNAVMNGAEIIRNCEVIGIKKHDTGFVVLTTQGEYECKYIINAAGIHADDVSRMIGDNSFSIYPRRGEYMLFDRKIGKLVQRTIFQMPVPHVGKGVLVTPTADGNLLIGPNAENLTPDRKKAFETTVNVQKSILESAKKSIPEISMNGLITSFAGLRAISDNDDFIIRPSKISDNFFHVAGMQSPGLSASPSIAEFVAEWVSKKEGGLPLNKEFLPEIKKPVESILELSFEELDRIVKKNPDYGQIICRCETISLGQIKDAINCKCGATDIDGVKKRTRAGLGRCQGGFCMPRVLEILAKETGKNFTEITKNGDNSYILTSQRNGVSI